MEGEKKGRKEKGNMDGMRKLKGKSIERRLPDPPLV